jgi:hypothetical protein
MWLLNLAENILANWVASVYSPPTITALVMLLVWVAFHWRRRWHKKGRSGVEPLHLIWGGTIGAGLCTAIVIGGLIWQLYSAQPVRTSQVFTPGIGTPLLPHRDTIQWHEILGTSRSVDLVSALFLDGTGPEDRAVKLKDAFIESASGGHTIPMQVVSTDNPLEQPFPISEANPVPPNGFIRLIARLNPRAPNEGVPNKEFLERWRALWVNVIYDDDKKDRISFGTSGYFPGLAGPHVTRKE